MASKDFILLFPRGFLVSLVLSEETLRTAMKARNASSGDGTEQNRKHRTERND
jgi:hypothetical protein